MGDVSDEHEESGSAGDDVVSLGARWFDRARQRAAQAGAPAELVADVAELGKLTARIEALASQPDPDPQPDGSDILIRYERGAELQDLNAEVAEILARVAEDPAETAAWDQIAASQRESAALARRAAAIVADRGNAK
jgi:hypothetical protein